MLLAPSYINILNLYPVRFMHAPAPGSLIGHLHTERSSPMSSKSALAVRQVTTTLTLVCSDVSWGTKDDNKVSTVLGVVKTSKGENAVEVAVPTAETEINAAYEDAIQVLSTKPPKEKKVDAATKQEDYYRNFRTKCVRPQRSGCC